MTIELYVFPPSPRAFKVMVAANHLGLDWTPRMIDLRKGEQKAPQYAALNPNMRMPTLKDGDFVLWESNAILQYLASKRQESGLVPAEERAGLGACGEKRQHLGFEMDRRRENRIGAVKLPAFGLREIVLVLHGKESSRY